MKAADWDTRYAASELLWGSGPNRFVEAELSSLPPGRALDVACGEGRNAIWLAERGWTVIGVDYSSVAVERARRLAAERDVAVSFEVGDVIADPTRGVFDLVLIAYLQLPPGERRAILRSAVSSLAPGGTLFLVGHDRANLEHGWGGPSDPSVLWDVVELEKSLIGLDVEQLRTVERDVPGAPRAAIDTLVSARRPR